jgi:predicted ATPase
MIRSVHLQNFKCFQDETLGLRPMTLVVGANGAGKSSLLQALLLIQQAADPSAEYVKLNGPFLLNLGKTADVLCQFGDAQSDIRIAIEASSGETRAWRFTERKKEEYVLGVSERPSDAAPFDLTYLNAERIGPRDTLEVNSVPSDDLGVGSRGEFTAQVLAAHVLAGRKRGQVREGLRHPRTEEEGNLIQLGKQVELWMGEITPGIEIRPLTLPDTNSSAIRIRRKGIATEWLRPPNIGFGVSYALPIVVAGLLSPPGSLFLVENPEAHLHPAGQSRIGRFLAMLAAADVQVIAETHSDHVLNGIRLAAVESQHPIRHDQIIVQYFHGDDEAPRRTEAIDVTAKGGLSSWPTGFFDQSEADLAAILGARSRG